MPPTHTVAVPLLPCPPERTEAAAEGLSAAAADHRRRPARGARRDCRRPRGSLLDLPSLDSLPLWDRGLGPPDLRRRGAASHHLVGVGKLPPRPEDLPGESGRCLEGRMRRGPFGSPPPRAIPTAGRTADGTEVGTWAGRRLEPGWGVIWSMSGAARHTPSGTTDAERRNR